MNIKHLLKTVAILLCIVAVFGVAMFGLNFITGPIIEANNEGAANDRLNAVMPGGSSYEDITSTLTDLPASVIKVNREKSGLGYVLECSASSQYTGSTPMDIVIGIDATGKICGINLVSHSESLIFGADYPSTYIGKDSALADVGLYSGSTYSSTAFKTAVEEAMNVLIVNNMITAGVKSADQLLTEMIPSLAPGFASGSVLKCTDIAASGNITVGYKAINDSGFAFIMSEGENLYLALVNSIGSVKLYDTEGNDVTESKSALAEEAMNASSTQTNFADKLSAKITALMDGATDIAPVTFDSCTNVVAAAEFKVGETKYYAFYSRPLTYEDNPIDIYTVIDENGAIAKQEIPQLLYGHGIEYMPVYGEYGDTTSSKYTDYENSFGGLTSDSIGDNILISGATISTTAIKTATQNAFDIFNTIKNGGAQ